MNLLPREVLRRAYETVPQPSHLIVDSILDIGRHSQVVKVADRSPMAVVNRWDSLGWRYPHLLVFQRHMPIGRVVPSLYGILVYNGWWSPTCRNPTLAKCGGEAQHSEKVRTWSPSGLPNV
jgi:hypothetical protein